MKNKDKKVKKNTQKNTLLRKTFIRFIIELIVWTIFIPIGTMIFIRIVSIMDFQWVHDLSSEFYYGVKDRYFNITVLNKINVEIYIVWFIGVLIIIYRLIKKTFSYVNTISQAAKDLMNKELEYIELPKGFDELEKQMNQLKRDYEKSERLAKENEQRKNDLIVYLAHDLKTPLTSTIGYLSLVDEIKDMPKAKGKVYISST